MSLLLIAAAVVQLPGSAENFRSVQAAAGALAEEVQTGTLIFSNGDCLAIKVFAGGPYTHVAAVVVEGQEPFVYESTRGAGVRRRPLARYVASQDVNGICIFQPTVGFTKPRREKFIEHLRSRLGREYAIRHYLGRDRSDGLHCSEYVTDALQACNLIRAERPWCVSPASLAEGLLKAELYTAAKVILWTEAPNEPPLEANWCTRTWSRTKRCTGTCCRQLQRWFLCK